MSDNATAIRTVIDLYRGSGEIDDLVSLLADDVECTDWTMPGQVFTGPESVMNDCFGPGADGFPDATEEILETIASDDQLFIRARFSATFAGAYRGVSPHGRRISYEIADTWSFRDGRVVRMRFGADTLAAAVALGAIPEEHSPW